MVPFPAAHGAAGAPMEWTLVAPFLELPLSCAALAALANRARRSGAAPHCASAEAPRLGAPAALRAVGQQKGIPKLQAVSVFLVRRKGFDLRCGAGHLGLKRAAGTFSSALGFESMKTKRKPPVTLR